MVVVVALEPPRKLRQDRLCIRAIMNVNIIPLEVLANDSATPFDCGARTGVKYGTRPIDCAKEAESLARWQLPLSETHATGCAVR